MTMEQARKTADSSIAGAAASGYQAATGEWGDVTHLFSGVQWLRKFHFYVSASDGRSAKTKRKVS